MAYIFSIFFLCVGLFCKAQDTVFLVTCEKIIQVDKKQNYQLRHSIFKYEDTLLMLQEFFNNSYQPIFAEPQDEKVIAHTSDYGIVAEQLNFEVYYTDELWISPMVLPYGKLTRWYYFIIPVMLDFATNLQPEGWSMGAVGGTFSFTEYPQGVPIYKYLYKPYWESMFGNWLTDDTRKWHKIRLICELPK